MSTWRQFPVHEFCPFCSILIALCFSLGNSFSLSSTRCTPRKLSNQMWHGKYSLTHTSSVSIKLLVLSFCLEDFEWTIPVHKDINTPVWLVISLCTAYAVSTQVVRVEKDLVPITRTKSMVFSKYTRTIISLTLSWWAGSDTLVQRRETAVSMSGLARLQMYKSFCTSEWKTSELHLSRASKFSSILNESVTTGFGC